jgi:predicted Fe-Mo cluster-binding NifX family protein
MGKTKIAIATVGSKGLGDEVADTFTKSNTLTFASIDGNRVHLEVLKNPGASLPNGRGPAVVRMLKERGVDIVVASEFGPGASALLEQSKIRKVVVEAGTIVGDIIRDKLYKKG